MSLRDALRKVPVQDIVSRDFVLSRSGARYLRAMAHDSLVVDLKKNLFFWNSLGVGGDGYDWLTKIRGLSSMDAIEILQQHTNVPIREQVNSTLFIPSGPYYKLLKVFHELGLGHREYWYGRGYVDDTIDLFQLGWTGKYYVIPILHEGKLLNFQCRTPEKRMWTWTKGRGKEPFNFGILKENPHNWVIITESPVDAIIATQYGFPAVSLLPNALNFDRELLGYFHKLAKVYLLFDNDKAGRRGMKNVGKMLPSKAWVPQWEGYPDKTDVGDVLKNDGPVVFSMLLDNCLPWDVLDDPLRKKLYLRARRVE